MADKRLLVFVQKNAMYLAWVVVLAAVMGSLTFSEILGYVPCEMCWIQRILLFPQSLLLGMAIYRSERFIIPYLLPLNMLGMFVALYQYLEQQIPGFASILPCTVGVPCSQKDIDLFGFITIPLLSLIAFSVITVLLWLGRKQ